MTHTHYKGTGKIHSFRGLLEDGGQDKIGIQGATGEIAWRIVKFEIIPEDPAGTAGEIVAKIYREEQDLPVTNKINFADGALLGCAYYSGTTSPNYPQDVVIVFDNTLFSRNIYVTNIDSNDAASTNYYIELEEVKVGKAGMAQLSLAASRRMQTDV